MSTTTTTTTTVYYTDSTPPLAYTKPLNAAIPGATTTDANIMEYALYKDDKTWNAWVSWAGQNALSYDRTTKYSSVAFQLVGNWPTMAEGEKSFMCIEDKATSANKGAVCMEANITGTTFATKTYRIPTASVATKISGFDATTHLAKKDFIFTTIPA